MATKSIGSSGRDHATVQLWEDSLPGTLTENEIGECYNDSEFSSSSQFLTISGHSGSFDITLKCASGHSWSDNAGVRTNAKKYNQSNGVAFNNSGSYLTVFYIAQARFFLHGLQIKGTGFHSRPINAGDASDTYIKDCIVDSDDTNSTGVTVAGSSARVINTTVYLRNSASVAFGVLSSSWAIACDAIRDPGVSATGTGFSALYGSNVMQSCTSFGFTNPASAGAWDGTNSKYNATDAASGLPGSNNQHSVTFNDGSPWTSADAATLDLRPIAATSLIDNGFLNSTDAANDCTGTARDSTPTIGSWEYSAGGGPTTYYIDVKATTAAGASVARRATRPKAFGATVGNSASVARRKTGVRSLTGSTSGVSSLARLKTYSRSLAATMSAALSLDPITTRLRTLSVASPGSASLSKFAAKSQALSASAGSSVSLALRKTYARTLAVGTSCSSTLSRLVSRLRTLSAASAGAATLSKPATRPKGLAASAGGVAAMSQFQARARALSASVAGSASMARLKTYARTLAGASAGVPALSRLVTRLRGLSVASPAAPVLSRRATRIRALAASVAGSGTLSTLKARMQGMAAQTAAGASLARRATYPRTLARTVTVGASMALGKTLRRGLSAVAAGAPVVGRRLVQLKTLTATAGSSVVIRTNRLYRQAMSVASSILASLVALFSGGGTRELVEGDSPITLTFEGDSPVTLLLEGDSPISSELA